MNWIESCQNWNLPSLKVTNYESWQSWKLTKLKVSSAFLAESCQVAKLWTCDHGAKSLSFLFAKAT